MKKSRSVVLGPKPTKACVNCRRLKMRCEVAGPPPCRRCRQTNTACVFKPRANAAAIHELVEESQKELRASQSMMSHDNYSILNRLDRIEAALGISQYLSEEADLSPSHSHDMHDMSPEAELGDVPLHGVWKAIAHLRIITRPPPDERVWSRPLVKQLWSSFLNNLPLLHFLTDRSAFASPTPLLLASVLYISALHHSSSELASSESGYFAATCSAIAELVIPSSHPGLSHMSENNYHESEQNQPPPATKCKEFHNILGLIMASLSSEAYIDATGSWIAMAYRLWLDHCPSEMDKTTAQDWRGLFSGLQVIDIEHASMHMSYPLLPRHPPNPDLQRLDSHQGNAFQGLAEMMHYGMSHFVGRGLPTIWSSVNADVADSVPVVRTPFTEKDSKVIRLWARKLDDWLVRYNGAVQPSPSDRQGILILLQYHLHKLYVLSIYHPARGFDLGSANISSGERHELLVSARAVLRLRQDDASIWSNWDLVMITWAALLLLRGVEDGMTHPDDLNLIQAHLHSLERSHQSALSIHTVLSRRLESGMQTMHTPPDSGAVLAFPFPNAEDSWTIFDQDIMSLANPPWLFQDSSQLTPSHKPADMQQPPPQLQSGMATVGYDSSLLVNNSQSFAANPQWNVAGQIQDALPTTMNRLFGNENSAQDGGSLM
ncbi:uncharacterized protein PFLUO_LOCUS8028 [Penicillium psychrofluorescens]|uniref:uncharacterized protein n=1 Tax=Penicillium psychrofluorescens TaxID=3158075 RepID=UPI003CCDC613